MDGQRFAVLIGNGRYQENSGLANLRCSEMDVRGLERIFSSESHGPYRVQAVIDADRDEILRAVYQTLSLATRSDTVVIYYSGHGKLDSLGNLYLAVRNTLSASLPPTAIPIDEIKKYMHMSHSGAIILVLDCCFSGAVGRGFKGGKSEQAAAAVASGLKQGEGIFVLTASTDVQLAEEKEGDTYSLLTKFLVKGIEDGEADVDQDGLISVNELAQYVREQVPREGGQEPRAWALNAGTADVFVAKSGREPLEQTRRDVRNAVYELAKHGFINDEILGRVLPILNKRLSDHIGEHSVKDIIKKLGAMRTDQASFVGELYRLSGRNEPSFRERLSQFGRRIVSVTLAFRRLVPPAKITIPIISLASLLTFATIWKIQTGLPFSYASKWLKGQFGDVTSQTNLAESYFSCTPNVRYDAAKARSWYARAANAGDPEAERILASFYLWGMGGPENKGEAEKWLKKSFTDGDPNAGHDLQVFFNFTPKEKPAATPTQQSGSLTLRAETVEVVEAIRVLDPGVEEYQRAEGAEERSEYGAAEKLYEESAKLGYAAANVRLASLFERGPGTVTKSQSKAFSSYLAGARAGDTEAQLMVGLYVEHGWGVSLDQKTALSWYQHARSQGREDAAYRSDHLGRNQEWKFDGPDALFEHEILESEDPKATMKSDDEAHVAWLYATGHGTPKDLAKAELWYKRAGDRGNPDALYRLSFLYADGPLRNLSRMGECLCKSALRGFSLAEVEVADRYGSIFAENRDQSKQWMQRAAEQGLVSAQELMWNYLSDDPPERAQREEWMRRAAKAGSITAMEFLAEDLMGEDELKAKTEGLQWWLTAAKAGSGRAQMSLGELYEDGDEDLGLKTNLVEARKWYTLAASQSSFAEQAKYSLENLGTP